MPLAVVPMRLPSTLVFDREDEAAGGVGRDDVARGRRCAPDGVTDVFDEDAAVGVAQVLGAALVRTNVVTLDAGWRSC